MFVREVKKYVPQQSYNGKVYLSGLQKIDIKTIEGRFMYMLELLKIADSVKAVKLYDGTKLPDIAKLKTLLGRSLSYYTNLNMIRHMIEESCSEISFELESENYTEESFKLIPKILSKEITVEDFFNSKDGEDNNPLWVFNGKSGEVYSGKGASKLFVLNTEQILDVITNLETKDKKLIESIEHFLNNEKEHKKYFGQVRMAGIQILKKYLGYIDTYLLDEYNKRVEKFKAKQINNIGKDKTKDKETSEQK